MTRPHLRALRCTLTWLNCLLCLLLLTPSPARTQPVDPGMTEMFEALEFDEDDNAQKPLQSSRVNPISLQVQWRLFKEVLSTGASGANEMRALQQDAQSVGHANMPATTFAAIHLVRQAHARADIDTDTANDSLKAISTLSPALPHPELARAWLLANADISRVGEIASAFRRGLTRAVSWPDTRIPYQFNLATFLLLASIGAAFLFLMSQLVRYFGVLSYDFVRVLPTGFSSNQAVILLLAALIVPGLLLQSPLLSGVLLLIGLSVVQQPRERIVTALIFGMLLALPTIEDHLSDSLTWADGDSRELLQAQYAPCDDACFAHIESLYLDDQDDAKDILLDYTYWHLVYRRGHPDQLLKENGLDRATVDAWPTSMRGWGYNILGAALVARGDAEEAIDLLTKAEQSLSDHPAPSINLLRAHQMLGDQKSAGAALKRANDRDLTKTLNHLGLKRRDANSYLMAPPLPTPFFWSRHRAANTQEIDLIARAWPYLAGTNVGLGWARYLGGAGLLILLLTLALPIKGITSTPCPSCGLARDPEDGKHTGNHPFCANCYRTFIAGASMEYKARVSSEETLSRRRRLQSTMRRVASGLLPGTGHTMSGYAVAGTATALVLFMGLLLLWRPEGLWHAPEDLLFRDWLGLGILGGLAFATAYIIGFTAASQDVRPVPVRTRQFDPQAQRDAKDQDAPGEEKGDDDAPTTNALAALILHHAITVIMIVGMLALGVWSYVTFKQRDIFWAPKTTESSTQRYLIASQLERMTLAAHTYQRVHETYPVSLLAIVEEGLLDRSDLSYPSPRVSYNLRLDGEDISIMHTLNLATSDTPEPSEAPDEEEDAPAPAPGDEAPAE